MYLTPIFDVDKQDTSNDDTSSSFESKQEFSLKIVY